MGHGSDKLYITHREHAGEFGDHHASSAGAKKKPGASFQRLPFDCCAISFRPFEMPVCTPDGTTCDLLNIIPYIRKYSRDPVTGSPLTAKQLTKLNFFKNTEDNYYDPVTFKVFTEHTPIVAIKTSGNVFSKESIDRLNIKPGHWHDLVTDEKFTRADLITLQDPHNVEKKDLSRFDHLQKNFKVTDEAIRKDPLSGMNVSAIGGTIGAAPTPYNASVASTGRSAASFTSTSLTPVTKTEVEMIDEEDFMFQNIKDKGYLKISTNLGDLNIELYCDRAPRTCYNFFMLAHKNYYDNTVFHRLIPGFMIQGGDPTGTGKGGESYWGKPFGDEFHLRNAHKHTARGTLSMANHGKDTNGSQFFITFRDTPHLNGKHTVFGRVVGGENVLAKLEACPIDQATDKPRQPLTIRSVLIFDDPFEKYKDRLSKRLKKELNSFEAQEARSKLKEERSKDRLTWFGTTLDTSLPATTQSKPTTKVTNTSSSSSTIGKYLPSSTPTTSTLNEKRKEGIHEEVGVKQAAKRRKGFGDLSGW
ncbi:uncharacterized protein MELLADRAFT_53693 [Melampsora larici-populina 98AG31]|uniref:Peptidylprolyl isomerase n=1 Tax=Melampsora larici-populina (strain 98AG31 / pathotype 3-4-7) TaxID=747676 RepID=F4S2T5_MELLP|nr:uncharacterized protein MELLADRAFT_53693 [Melampsora larici-populina 98AG31]EGG01056.1 hypothetical protein MELLADRAFT_53693 [Melampsora larici-populina 98AG31]